jgi:Asp-tRNA(Asn)/Glu-tRNA(Gln) amidotransferase A subunit family amidase
MGQPVRFWNRTRPRRRGKKARDYYRLVKGTVEENERSGSLFKLGIKFSVDVLGKLLGRSVSWHPYFTYHKAHMEMLAQALNVSSISDAAWEALNRAISAADSIAALAGSLDSYEDRKNALVWDWMWSLKEPIRLVETYKTNPAGVSREIADSGQTPEQMAAYVDDYLDNWRARWAELCVDCFTLLGMVDAEYRMAEAAMARYNQKMQALRAKGSLGTIAAAATQEKRDWEQYDRMVNNPKGKSAQAVEDPAAYAKKQRDMVDQAADVLADTCDILMSDAVRKADFLIQNIRLIQAKPTRH